MNMASGQAPSLMRIKNARRREGFASRRSQRFGGGRVEKARAAGNDLDHAITLQLGKRTAHGLDGQTEIIRNVLPAHRQWQDDALPVLPSQAITPADQDGGNLLLGR